MGNFYEFHFLPTKNSIQAHMRPQQKIENKMNWMEKLIRGEYNQIELPIHFVPSYGNKYLDVICTGWPNLYLLSKTFGETLDKQGFLGYKLFPVNIVGRNLSSDYCGLSFTGICGKGTFLKRTIFQKSINNYTLDFYRGLYIDSKSWDGSDFFMCENYSFVLCTERVNDFLSQAGIPGFKSTEINLIEIDATYV